jgi:hypothetical protein
MPFTFSSLPGALDTRKPRDINSFSEILRDNNAILAGKAVLLHHFSEEIGELRKNVLRDAPFNYSELTQAFTTSTLKLFVKSSKLRDVVTAITKRLEADKERFTIVVATKYNEHHSLKQFGMICCFNFVTTETEHRTIDVFVVAEDTKLHDVVRSLKLVMYYDGNACKDTERIVDANQSHKPNFHTKCVDILTSHYDDYDGCENVREMLWVLGKRVEDDVFPENRSLKELEIMEMPEDVFGLFYDNIYEFVTEVDQSADDLATLIQENDTNLNVEVVLTFLLQRKAYIPVILNLLDITMRPYAARILNKFNIPLAVGAKDREQDFDKLLEKAREAFKYVATETDIPPFEKSRFERAVLVLAALRDAVKKAHTTELTQVSLEPLNEKLTEFVSSVKNTHLHPTKGTIVSANSCMTNCQGNPDNKRGKTGRSSRFCDVFVPFLVITSNQDGNHFRNQDMSHICRLEMYLYHYITDASVPKTVFTEGNYIFTHDVIYAHKEVDWYWADESVKPAKINIRWPAGAPYYDWCHYKDILGNVCILPPAMWVVETIEKTKGYLEYEVTISPKILFMSRDLQEDLQPLAISHNLFQSLPISSSLFTSDPLFITTEIYDRVEETTASSKHIAYSITYKNNIFDMYKKNCDTLTGVKGTGINLTQLYTYLICKYVVKAPISRVPFNIRPNTQEYEKDSTGHYVIEVKDKQINVT